MRSRIVRVGRFHRRTGGAIQPALAARSIIRRYASTVVRASNRSKHNLIDRFRIFANPVVQPIRFLSHRLSYRSPCAPIRSKFAAYEGYDWYLADSATIARSPSGVTAVRVYRIPLTPDRSAAFWSRRKSAIASAAAPGVSQLSSNPSASSAPSLRIFGPSAPTTTAADVAPRSTSMASVTRRRPSWGFLFQCDDQPIFRELQ